MDHIPSPRELKGAARACTFLAYAAGLTGVAAGTLMLRDGELAFAIILWTTTFAVGATLMGVSVLVRAVSGLATQLTRMEHRVEALASDRARDGGDVRSEPGRDPWLRH
jgi:choline-glycine betaine transporter